MSKAMDALDSLRHRINHKCAAALCLDERCEAESCVAAWRDFATLRDYIATTEARETAWAIALAGEQLAHETDLTQSAARIKELEEALRIAQEAMRRWYSMADNEGLTSQADEATSKAEMAQVVAALSGARKVNQLGSVRGDEHLGAMLPDEAIFDARKVEQ